DRPADDLRAGRRRPGAAPPGRLRRRPRWAGRGAAAHRPELPPRGRRRPPQAGGRGAAAPARGALERLGAGGRGRPALPVRRKEDMIAPEWLQLLYALAGAFLGWWLKHRSGAGPLPAEVVELVRLMLARRKEQQAEEMLRGLLESARDKEAP